MLKSRKNSKALRLLISSLSPSDIPPILPTLPILTLFAVFASCAHSSHQDPGDENESSTRVHVTPRGISAGILPPPPDLPEKRAPFSVEDLLARSGRDAERNKNLSPSMRLESELARLSYILDSLRASNPNSSDSRPTKAGIATWERIINELDAYLDQPPQTTSAIELVRAKVTVKNELSLDSENWRMPGHLAARVRSRLAYMESRIENAQNDFSPIPEGDFEPLSIWPIEPAHITSDFGWRADPFHGMRRFHYGVDLKAAYGQLVISAGEGSVEWADWNGGHGKHVEILHPEGWTTRYSHLAKLLVRVGDKVEAGDPIGLAGSTGRATGPHLHFEVWRYDQVVDPTDVLGDPSYREYLHAAFGSAD